MTSRERTRIRDMPSSIITEGISLHTQLLLCPLADCAPTVWVLASIPGPCVPPFLSLTPSLDLVSTCHPCLFCGAFFTYLISEFPGLFLHFTNTSWITQTWKTVWNQYPSELGKKWLSTINTLSLPSVIPLTPGSPTSLLRYRVFAILQWSITGLFSSV